MKGPKTVWVPKEKIIPLADILNPNKKTQILELGKWVLTIHVRKSTFLELRVKRQRDKRKKWMRFVGIGQIRMRHYILLTKIYLRLEGLSHLQDKYFFLLAFVTLHILHIRWSNKITYIWWYVRCYVFLHSFKFDLYYFCFFKFVLFYL